MRYLLILLLTLSSCGKFEEKFGRLSSNQTTVNFALEGREGSPLALLSGIMVYAVRSADDRSRGARLLPNETTPVDWVIPNGVYDFFAVGYGSPNLGGVMYCGRELGVPLSGGSTQVQIEISSTGQCGTPPFAPAGYSANSDFPKSLNLAFCLASGGDIGITDASSGFCDGGGGRPGDGIANSVRINLPEFVAWNPNQEPVGLPGEISVCVNSVFTGTGGAVTQKVPFGKHFPVEVETFSSASCVGRTGSYVMKEGISSTASNGTVNFRNGSDTLIFPGLQMMNPTLSAGIVKLYMRNY